MSTIDLIYTNSEYVSESGCIDIMISDHLAMYVTHKKVNPPATKIQFEGRSYDNNNTEDFRYELL